MPARTLALLIGTVIALGGATVWLAHSAGLPMMVFALVALAATIVLRLRR
ncbi:hypothetical protein [Gemmobacter denitrificans]|uniref:Secreted protein with PEP-CTERM sorting signal n=1 Tax=Gemmobacter denitrificans TaxID=3123040 RepID=A0ABU8BZH3_9RHOB